MMERAKWQVTADLVFASRVPPGYAHDYGEEPVDAWAHIAPPRRWTDERTAALKQVIADSRAPARASSGQEKP